jgi:hypothetical protein
MAFALCEVRFADGSAKWNAKLSTADKASVIRRRGAPLRSISALKTPTGDLSEWARQRFRFIVKDQEEAVCRVLPIGAWRCGARVRSCGLAGNEQSISPRRGGEYRQVSQHFSKLSPTSGSLIDFRLRGIDNWCENIVVIRRIVCETSEMEESIVPP